MVGPSERGPAVPAGPSAAGAESFFGPLDESWDRAIEPSRSPGGSRVVLFSGGLDSGLLAWELRGRPSTELFTVGRLGAPDLDAAARSSRAIGLPWSHAVLTEALLARTLARLSGDLGAVPPARRSIFVALAAAIEAAPPGELVCGQGADELFLGYAHFQGLPPADALARSDRDLDRLVREDWPRTQRWAAESGRRVRAPYLDAGFIGAVRSIPIAARMPNPEPKALLRAWARRRGLPEVLAARPKKALQFGTRVDGWLRARPGLERKAASASGPPRDAEVRSGRPVPIGRSREGTDK
jgi:asparagine synthase (glutamine-hydrolysing)